MAEGNGIKEKLETLSDQTQELAMTALKIAQVEVTKHVSKMASSAILFLIMLIMLNVLLIFIGFASATWIGNELNDPKIGLFIVAGFFLVVIIVMLAIAKKVIIPFLRNIIIQKLYE